MTFCMRGSRFVPQIVQVGCGNTTVHRFSSRQLPAPRAKQPQAVASSSAFLNELRIKDDCATTNESNCHNTYILVSSIPVDEQQLRSQPAYEVIEHDTHPLSRMQENHHFIISPKESWLHFNNTSSLRNLAVLPTKDETKVQYAGLADALKTQTNEPDPTENEAQKKSNQDLVHVYETLKIDFTEFFKKSINYRIYHPELEFINNIKGTQSKGLPNYVKQIAFLKIAAHLKFTNVKMDVLKITMHPQDNTVRVRWRITGIKQYNVLLNLFKINILKMLEKKKGVPDKIKEVWYDGFSTFYVGNDGLVYKHVAEKMMPDDDLVEAKPKGGLTSKLASLTTP